MVDLNIMWADASKGYHIIYLSTSRTRNANDSNCTGIWATGFGIYCFIVQAWAAFRMVVDCCQNFLLVYYNVRVSISGRISAFWRSAMPIETYTQWSLLRVENMCCRIPLFLIPSSQGRSLENRRWRLPYLRRGATTTESRCRRYILDHWLETVLLEREAVTKRVLLESYFIYVRSRLQKVEMTNQLRDILLTPK